MQFPYCFQSDSSWRCAMCMNVTINGVSIEDRIYWTLWYSAWLHFTVHYYTHTHTHTHTSVHSHVFTSRCSVAASNSGHSSSSGFPNYLRAQLPANHSTSSRQLNLSSSLVDYLTNQLTQLTELTPHRLSCKDSTKNTVPLLLFTDRCLVTATV
jgi:hypothetical protein